MQVGCFSGGVILDAGMLCCQRKPARSPFVTLVTFSYLMANKTESRPLRPRLQFVSQSFTEGCPPSFCTCPFPNRTPHELHPAPSVCRPAPSAQMRGYRPNGHLQELQGASHSQHAQKRGPDLFRTDLGNAQTPIEPSQLTRQTNLPRRNLSLVSCVSTQSYKKSAPRFPLEPYTPRQGSSLLSLVERPRKVRHATSGHDMRLECLPIQRSQYPSPSALLNKGRTFIHTTIHRLPRFSR
jgi:hypothetical protein